VSYTLPRVHEVRARSEVQAFTVEGEIDSVVVLALQRRISAALDAGYRRIVIDLSPVSAPGGQTSLMLGGALRRLAGRAATLAIAAGPPPMRRGLELCAIDRIVFYPDLDVAMPVLTRPPADRREVVCVTSVGGHRNERLRNDQIEIQASVTGRRRARARRGPTPSLILKRAISCPASPQ
jgi:anti-anti-sigma regulatory factor